MTFDSKYFDGISISAKKQKKQLNTDNPTCQWDGCEEPGVCRAPMGRMYEGQYLHFCIEHVREYNKNFNYFSGLSQPEIAKFQREAITGHRPTWPLRADDSLGRATAKDFSVLPSGSASYQNKIRDVMGITKSNEAIRAPLRKLKPLEEKALKTLGLGAQASKRDIKMRYKKLVKELHPDTNGGDRSLEEQFLKVLNAYKILQKAGII